MTSVAPVPDWTIGTVLPSMKEAREVFRPLLRRKGCPYRVAKANDKQYYLVCRTDPRCPFNVRISKSRGGQNEGKVVVRKYQPQHHCRPSAALDGRKPSDTAACANEMAPGTGSPHSLQRSLASTRRTTACNECKQHKLRCDLKERENENTAVCSRCQRLKLECKLESGFQRSSKRGATSSLELEVEELRRRVAQYESSARALSTEPSPRGSETSAQLLAETFDTPRQQPIAQSAARTAVSHSSIEGVGVPSVTTRPVIDHDHTCSTPLVVAPQPRKLAGIELSVADIEELFHLYFSSYHPFLPFLKQEKSPHAYYESSELLFWSVIAAAAHRTQSLPCLLPRLAEDVMELLWATIRSIPYSLHVIQSLVIICAWPFPTSSSMADPTYTLAGTMLHLAFQMGLHCASSAEDFTKGRLNLSADQRREWVATWQACNIVAHSVSVGCGLPATVQLHDQSLPKTVPWDPALWSHLRIEQYRQRVSLALAPNAMVSRAHSLDHGRLAAYRLLNLAYLDLEQEIIAVAPSSRTQIYLSAARIHLHSFYLLDDSRVDGYTDRIANLYQSAYDFVAQSLAMDRGGEVSFHHWPFFCYQMFVSASCVILRIVKNGHFNAAVDIDSGKALLNSAILALRKISVANNDLPARLSDVIAFLYSQRGIRGVPGDPPHSLRPRVLNRLSMSIVYDSLWEWREHFRLGQSTEASTAAELAVPVGGDQVNIDFEQLGLADAFTFEWPDIDLDIPL
ncbi:hypothetical protein ASPVEDRAFT_29874 [Aspergillus versicolor CBS 583.65]|uniref:Zn(2)-C6 fungal-type domain-containing protein n=1 Tax=Aspergillus versicolor CBS 583.65 TaxID=1036611 RepID=A0A1L9PPC6_ASPVE|nr:uncharacterized protein ASPVEDRAFT_29874 [Aspergillus versicolor CBS 583.65]OJJ03351.1 hypothetical protein ASPVEDRAFT_29874 [Aspergillus versicolor CBS 583.65]